MRAILSAKSGLYFYPRPPRGGRRRVRHGQPLGDRISIHALREEGDRLTSRSGAGSTTISIHALREEGDRSPCGQGRHSRYFYPRPPRGGRLGHLLAHFVDHLISIHALREEGDWSTATETPTGADFYPRPPRGGRPFCTW